MKIHGFGGNTSAKTRWNISLDYNMNSIEHLVTFIKGRQLDDEVI